MSSSKFENFTIKDSVYKTVNNHAIETAVCIPKNAYGKRPVLVNLHGGFLIIGDKMIESWSAKWLIQLAESKGAIMVRPNYRLMPEATGKDILADLSDFYDWVQSCLAGEVAKISPSVEVDLAQILVAGESAGGYLATQSALHFPQMGFKAVISQYGMIDMEHEHFTQAGHKDMAGTPHLPMGVVDDYVNGLHQGAVRTSTLMPTLWSFIVETVRQGRLLEFLGEETDVLPMKKVAEVEEMPPFWIVNGKDDDLVPAEVSERFIAKLKETHPTTPLLYTLQPGPHGFDSDMTIDEPWVQEGCKFIKKYWAGNVQGSRL